MYAHLEIEALRVPKAGLMDREKFITKLDELTPAEIETRLASWDLEKLVLARGASRHTGSAPRATRAGMWREYHLKSSQSGPLRQACSLWVSSLLL